MPPEPRWPLSLLESVELNASIAYIGRVAEWARESSQRLHAFTYWEIREGWAEVITGGDEGAAFRVEAGEWIFIPHGVERHQRLERGTRLTSLSFRALWPNGRPVFLLPRPMTGPARSRLARLARAACGVLKTTGPSPSLGECPLALPDWLAFRSHLARFVGELLRHALLAGATAPGPFSGDTRLDAILADLRRDLHAGPLPYRAWQAQLGIGRAQADRVARLHLGGTLRARRDALLEEEIRHQLVFGKLSAKELAARYRFADAAHFSRWVRQRTGSSPKTLRQGGFPAFA